MFRMRRVQAGTDHQGRVQLTDGRERGDIRQAYDDLQSLPLKDVDS